jgi:hypothetical protein
MFYVSQSKINTWRTCQRKFWYKYQEGLRKKIKARPLQFGSIVHEMIEAQADGGDPFKKLVDIEKSQGQMFLEESEEYGDLIKSVHYVMDAYFKYYANDPIQFIELNGKKSEHDFEVEISSGITARGKIDAVVTYRNLPALLENKTHKIFPNEDGRWRNVQGAVYVRFMEMLQIFAPEGILWNYIRSKQPTQPQVLKNGTLSTRALDSLPAVVIEKCKELNIPVPAGLLADQEARLNTWFRRVFNPISKKVTDAIFRDFLVTSREMAELSHKRRARNIGKHCAWCEFEPICRTSLTGGDEDYVKHQDYTVSEDEPEDPTDIGDSETA